MQHVYLASNKAELSHYTIAPGGFRDVQNPPWDQAGDTHHPSNKPSFLIRLTLSELWRLVGAVGWLATDALDGAAAMGRSVIDAVSWGCGSSACQDPRSTGRREEHLRVCVMC